MLTLAAIRNLMRNPRRTLAILLTVAIGTGSLFLFHGFNAGIMNQYRANSIHAFYGYGQVNRADYREKVYEKPWEHWMQNWPDLKRRLLGIPGVTQVFPRINFFGLLSNGNITVSGRGLGVDGAEEEKFFSTINVVQGKMLSNESDGILMGVGLARSLDLKVGDKVSVLSNTIRGTLNGAEFTVVGLYHTGMKDVDDGTFRVQIGQAQTLLDTERVEIASLGLDGNEDWSKVDTSIKGEFPGIEATEFAVLDKVYYQNSVDWLNAQFNVVQFIMLAIVVLGIFNTVSTAVLERKQEIGNLRANGESAKEILALLTIEGLTLGILGALLGIIGGYIIVFLIIPNGILMPAAPGLTRQFYVKVELQTVRILLSFVLGFFCAVVASFLAGLRIAKMPIGEALRSN